jgi:hypothetical protein
MRSDTREVKNFSAAYAHAATRVARGLGMWITEEEEDGRVARRPCKEPQPGLASRADCPKHASTSKSRRS